MLNSLENQVKFTCEIMGSDPRIANNDMPITFIGASIGGLIARGVRQICDIGKRVWLFFRIFMSKFGKKLNELSNKKYFLLSFK